MGRRKLSLDDHLNRVNQRLREAQLGLTIERRGNKLALRGTLPPRPHSDRDRPHQQRLSLGLPANPDGLKQAEREVISIAGKLIDKTFDWRDYLPEKAPARLPLAAQIEAFEAAFLSRSDRPHALASTKTTWQGAYRPYLNKLRAIAIANPRLSLPKLIETTIAATPPNSRSRQTCCTALAAFADFLELELPNDLKRFWGSYGNSRTQARDLPSDEQIVQTWAAIPNDAWRFVYGVMATYGLRNHEVFFCDYSALAQGHPEATVQVLPTTKTGAHEVWPFYPEWVAHFQLHQVNLPPIQTDLTHTTLQRIGQRVSAQFRRYGLPFTPYDLRHAWAVRTIHFGLPDTVAAQMMGHSVAVHTRTYHQWITRRDQQRAVEAARSRSPLTAPTVPRLPRE